MKDSLAGKQPHINRIGISCMYNGAWVPNKSGNGRGGEFRVGPHIMIVVPYQFQGELRPLSHDGSNGMPYVANFRTALTSTWSCRFASGTKTEKLCMDLRIERLRRNRPLSYKDFRDEVTLEPKKKMLLKGWRYANSNRRRWSSWWLFWRSPRTSRP